MDKYAEVADVLQTVEKVLIVGGGPVGVELAGEILENYPDKQLTLVHSHDELIGERFADKFKQKAADQLRQLGILAHLYSSSWNVSYILSS